MDSNAHAGNKKGRGKNSGRSKGQAKAHYEQYTPTADAKRAIKDSAEGWSTGFEQLAAYAEREGYAIKVEPKPDYHCIEVCIYDCAIDYNQRVYYIAKHRDILTALAVLHHGLAGRDWQLPLHPKDSVDEFNW